MFRYFISAIFILCFLRGYSQNKPIDLQPKDTAVYKQPYGLRVGIDLSRPVRSFFDDNYTGLEIVGDYRLTQKMYLAAELGNEERTREEELEGTLENSGNIGLYNYTTSGSYLKVGIDFNTYENWYGMNNSIHIGGRYAFSSFSQTLNSFNFYDSNRFFSADGFVEGSTTPEEFNGLNASWLEFVFGTKVELYKNIYLGASVRVGLLITEKESDRFPNLWIPGFNKVTDDSSFGV
ncbi:MAG: DUF6048 family protein, partial [Bacteroidota bacterium]